MADLHLIGIGVQHVKTGGEDSFVEDVKRCRAAAQGAAEQITALDRAVADMGGVLASAATPTSAMGRALADLARSGPEGAGGLSAVNREVQAGRDRAMEYIRSMQEVNAALLRNIEAERGGAEAIAVRNREILQAQALALAGVEAESVLGAAVLKEVGIWEELQVQMKLVREEREAEDVAAKKLAADEERLAAVLSQTRAKTATTQATTAAERESPAAVTALDRALEERNALLKAGVALIDAQGQLVITSQQGAAAVREEVEALQAAEAELAAVKVANEAAAGGSGLWHGLASILGEIGQALKYLVVYGGLISLAQGLKEAVEESIRLEASLTRLKTLVGLNAQEVEGFRHSIRDISLETGQSQDENAKALFAITSSGLRGEQALKALEASAQGASIGLGEQTTVARAAVSAMTAYGAGNLSAKDALDVLIATAREGNTTVEDLAGAFGRVTGVAAAVGVRFSDLGAAIASMTRVGVSADEAVTGLRSTLSALELKNAKGANEALKSVGFSVAELRAEIKDKGLAPALVDLVSRFDGNNDALARVIPNIRALAEVLSNAKSQAGQYVEIQDRVNASIGHATDDAVALIQHDPAHVFATMRAALADVSLELVSGLLPSLVALAQEIKAAIASGDVETWARAVAVGFDAIVIVGRVFVFVLGALGPLLVSYAVWAIAAADGTTAFGTALGWCEARLVALDAAIAANPLGAIAVAAIVVEEALRRLIERQREMDQAWLDENARINQTALNLASLRNEYIRVYEVRDRGGVGPPQSTEGPAASVASGMFGTSHVELRDDAGTFLGDLKKINQTYQDAVKAAGDNKEALGLAKMARDRDTASLQAHERAYLDDIQAGIRNTEALLAQETAARDSAQNRADEAGQRSGNRPAIEKVWSRGPDGAMAQTLVPNQDLAAMKAAEAEVQHYNNSLRVHQAEVRTAQEVHDKLGTELDRSRLQMEGNTAGTEKASKSVANFHLEIAKQIAVRAQEIASARDLAAAELLGGEAVARATTLAKENKAVVEAQQKAIKDHTTLRADEEAAIRSGIEALDDENRSVALNKALRASELQTQRDQATGYAKIADAVSNTSTASQRLAAVLAVEALAEQNGISLSDARIQRLKAEALARVDANQQTAATVAETEQERQYLLDLRDAEAAYADTVDRSTTATTEAVVQKKIEAALKAEGIDLTAKLNEKEQQRADVIASTVRAQQDDIKRTKDRTAAQKLLNEELLNESKERAKFDDLSQERAAVKLWGQDITDVLSKYGLLNNASKELDLRERARAEFELEHHQRSLAQIYEELKGRQETIDGWAREAATIEIARLQTDHFLTGLATVFDTLSSGLGGASTSLGRLAADMSKLVTAIQAVADAQGRANKLFAAAGVAASLGAALAELNVGGAAKSGGPQALGGKLEGNYAGIGSIVGIIVGAIVGYFTAGIGTGAGAAIGTALGTVLGSLISKAGDSASAALTAGGNITVGETSRQLDGAVHDALLGIFKGLNRELAALGLQLDNMPLIDIKVRDNIVRVVVGNVVRTFSNMQDAVSFGIAEALKQSATSGGHLPIEVLQALKNSTATTLDELKSDIAFAQGIANYGVPAVVQAIDKSVSDFFVAMQRAAELGISSTKVIAMFADQIKAQKDAILGLDRTKSPQDKLRADVEAFNQKEMLLKNEQTINHADLQVKKADLEGKIAILKGEMELARAHGALERSKLGVDASSYAAQAEMLKGMEDALAAVETALATSQAIIDSILLISDKELAEALARLAKAGRGSGAGSAAQNAMTTLLQMIDGVKWQVHIAGMTAFEQQLAEIDKKWHDAEKAAGLSVDGLAKVKAAHDAALLAAHGNAAAIHKANDAYERATRQIEKQQVALDAANAARQQEIDLLKKDLDTRVHDFVVKGTPGEGITSSLASIDDTSKTLITDAQALAKAGGMSSTELSKMVLAINAATAAQKAAVKDGVLQSVSDFLGGKGHTGLLGNLKSIGDTARGLTDNLQALATAGQISQEQLSSLSDQIMASAKEQQDAAIKNTAQGLLSDLYGYLHMDHESAVQKYEITMAELEARRAELAAAMMTAHYTQEAMDAILKPIDDLIGKVKAGGPALFETGSQAAPGPGGGGQGGHWVPNGQGGWTWVPDAGSGSGSGAQAQTLDQLLAQIQQFEDLALSPAARQLKSLNETFATMRENAVRLGVDLARVSHAQQVALQDFWNQQLQGIKQLRDSLTLGQYSPLTGQARLQQAQDDFGHLSQQALAGNLDALQKLPAAANALLQEARGFFGSGAGFQDIFTMVQSVLDQLLASHPNSLSAGDVGSPAVAGAGNNIVPLVPPGSGNAAAPTPAPVLPPPTGLVTTGGSNGTVDPTVAQLLARIEQLERDKEEAEKAREAERMKLFNELKDEQEKTRKATESMSSQIQSLVTRLDTTLTQLVQMARR